MKRKVYYAVLNMGLGHAARSLPVIQEFENRGWEVVVGSNGRALEFLKKELSRVYFVQTPDYGIEYSKNHWLLFKLGVQVPRVLQKINKEHALCSKIVKDFFPDLIFSDHCYGAYHKNVLSYFLSHQIKFALPPNLQFVQKLSDESQTIFHRHFDRILIPDNRSHGRGLLSGELSRVHKKRQFYCFPGMLSSLSNLHISEDLDVLISISGPEPQRTVLEDIVLDQVKSIPLKTVVVLGKSESSELLFETDNLTVYSHLPRSRLEDLFNQAKVVVSRPGYTTLMELMELNKKALLIPTPGQTEHEYLTDVVMQRGLFYCVKQNELDLARDIEKAQHFKSPSITNSTKETVQQIFKYIGDDLGKDMDKTEAEVKAEAKGRKSEPNGISIP